MKNPSIWLGIGMNIGETESLSVETTSTFSLDNNRSKKNVPDFNVFCPRQHSKQVLDCVKKYLMASTQVSSCKTLVFKQAIQVCYFFFPTHHLPCFTQGLLSLWKLLSSQWFMFCDEYSDGEYLF